jgi:2-octaprenyl-6-methoxyphenol hydroxylase
MNFVDCIEPSEQSAIEKMTDCDYLNRLQTRFGYRLGKFKQVGPRFVMPLMRIESDAQTSRRTALMGNAARLLHPVGGQGYNLSMRDVAELVRLLDKDVVPDPGADNLLSEFALARRADQQSIVRLTDMLARGFRGRAAIPGHLRSSALLGLDMITPLRKRFASKTMGVTGL